MRIACMCHTPQKQTSALCKWQIPSPGTKIRKVLIAPTSYLDVLQIQRYVLGIHDL